MALKNNILVPLPPMPWGRGRDKVGTNPGLPPSRSQSQGPHGFRTLRGAYCCLRPLPRVHLFPTPAALSKSAPCGFAQAARRLPATPCPAGVRWRLFQVHGLGTQFHSPGTLSCSQSSSTQGSPPPTALPTGTLSDAPPQPQAGIPPSSSSPAFSPMYFLHHGGRGTVPELCCPVEPSRMRKMFWIGTDQNGSR